MRKKAVLFIIALSGIFAVHAQKLDTLSGSSEQQYLGYMKKRSANKTFGWVLLGTGVTLAGGYFLINSANGWNGHNKGEGMFEVGVATAALSIPFFIMAGANNRKARLALKGERLTSAILFYRTNYPALSLSINL
jgi:hypothetical protein